MKLKSPHSTVSLKRSVSGWMEKNAFQKLLHNAYYGEL